MIPVLPPLFLCRCYNIALVFLQEANFLFVDLILLVPPQEKVEWCQIWYQWRTCGVIGFSSSLVREVFA